MLSVNFRLHLETRAAKFRFAATGKHGLYRTTTLHRDQPEGGETGLCETVLKLSAERNKKA